MVASLVERMGLPIRLGPDYGAGIGNPLGHFEDIGLAEISERAIQRSLPDSYGWQVTRYPPPLFEIAGENRAQARRLMVRRYRSARQWGWKDPRAVLCLDDWQQIVPRLHVVGLWRPADDVVGSLLRRADLAGDEKEMYQITARDACLTWIASNEALLRAQRLSPQRVTVLNLESCVATGGSLVSDALTHAGFAVKETPLSEVYSDGLLAGNSKPSLVPESLRDDVAFLESRLARHSFGERTE